MSRDKNQMVKMASAKLKATTSKFRALVRLGGHFELFSDRCSNASSTNLSYLKSRNIGSLSYPSFYQQSADDEKRTLFFKQHSPPCCQHSGSGLQKRKLYTSTGLYHKHSSSAAERNCWNCGRKTDAARENVFCDCGVVQSPAHEFTYFDLMNQDVSFDIDVEKLGEKFRETQMKLHPDRFTLKSKEEQTLAEQQSSLLNKAYNTLRYPLSRAVYILELQGITVTEKDTFSDPEFLMEIMEVSEEISSVKTTADLEHLENTNNGKINSCVAEISSFLKNDDWDNARNATIKLRYFTTIQERIKDLHRDNM